MLNDQFSEKQVVTYATHGKRAKGWLLPKAGGPARRVWTIRTRPDLLNIKTLPAIRDAIQILLKIFSLHTSIRSLPCDKKDVISIYTGIFFYLLVIDLDDDEMQAIFETSERRVLERDAINQPP